MKLFETASLGVALFGVAVMSAGCSSTALTPPKHDSGSDSPVVSKPDSGRDGALKPPKDASDAQMSSTDSGTDGQGPGGCSGHAPIPAEVPPVHRPTAAACPASDGPADGGGPCTTDADCPSKLFLLGKCLHGTCYVDRCLTDADCAANEVCSCASLPPQGSNVCVAANCHVDADCGPNGYCSPSFGRCGGVAGYYCHGSADTCIDGTKDCPSGQFCQYTPTTCGFSCAPPPVCGG